MPKVTVVGFEVDDIEREGEIARPVKATRETLARINGAREIAGTEQTVDEADLDGIGFFRPKP